MTNLNELDRLVQADHDALAEWNAARTAVSAALPRAHFESGWWRNREMAPGNAAFIEAVARSRAARDAHRMARAAYIAAASPDVVRALIARVRAAEAECVQLRASVRDWLKLRTESEAEDRWQPIDTAPAGEWVLAWGTRGTYGTGEVCTMVVRRDAWGWGDQHGHAFTPTHWMPLPTPPEAP